MQHGKGAQKMGFDQTEFKIFHQYCIRQFGEDTGSKIFEAAESRLAQMIAEADYKNSKAIQRHMDKNMLPTIAMYLAFQQVESTRESAYRYTAEILQTVCQKTQQKNRTLGNMPFGYPLFKLFCKSIIANQYPEEGWHTEWIQYTDEEIHFDFTSCIYMETTKRYHCPELCPLFCANDDITLAGYSPSIVFERSGTIGRGQTRCDFHFINGKYRKSAQ